MLGGVVGGVAGAVAFTVVDSLMGSMLGRWLGAGILGFCIGVMVALAELAFRRSWLEIAVSPREIRTVTLGSSAVTLGSDERQVSFFVAGVPEVALCYRLEGERVVCEDVTTGEKALAEPGVRRQLGKVTITVCTPASSTSTGFVLVLSDDRKVPLREGLPMTGEDLPGLTAKSSDGIVAIVSRPPNQPGEVLLRNRSRQNWSARKADGSEVTVEPGRAIELGVGVQVNFGQVRGVVRVEEVVKA
jgi:hypothetical protein